MLGKGRKKENLQKKNEAEETKPHDKVLEVDASMVGSLTFKDPVNLHIDGKFDGTLDTKGNLTIGEKAVIKANIIGESITIAGHVTGDITATKELTLVSPALVLGNVETPLIGISPGAILDGKIRMVTSRGESHPALEEEGTKNTLSLQEVASYLEVEARVVEDWASTDKIPAHNGGSGWTFNKAEVDRWIADEKVKI
jgi:excisionase family DNA binding protein